MFCHNLRPYLPWICTSIALGYAAYIHWKLRKIRKSSKLNEERLNDANLKVNIDSIEKNNFDGTYQSLLIDENKSIGEAIETIEKILDSNSSDSSIEENENDGDQNESKRNVATEFNDLVKEDNQIDNDLIQARRKSSLKDDLDDLAFDLFCSDEIENVNRNYSNHKRKLSAQVILFELLRRWDDLPDESKEGYLEKAADQLCWRSKKFPKCDGSHQCYNRESGDNVGPLTMIWNDFDDGGCEKQSERTSQNDDVQDDRSDTMPKLSQQFSSNNSDDSSDQDKDMDIKSIDSESPIQPNSLNETDSIEEFEQIDRNNSNNTNASNHNSNNNNSNNVNNNSNQNNSDEQLSSLEMI
uniref:CDGSH iron-sulfur domain-containing protein 2 homologue n=1 Tax=Sarcoptes scabiei TaxID=52283 RepID=A0A834R3N2_SARSC